MQLQNWKAVTAKNPLALEDAAQVLPDNVQASLVSPIASSWTC
jgi:hypothetical protein